MALQALSVWLAERQVNKTFCEREDQLGKAVGWRQATMAAHVYQFPIAV